MPSHACAAHRERPRPPPTNPSTPQWHATALLLIGLYGCAAGRSGDYESMGLLIFFGYLWTQDLTMLLALHRVTVLNVATVFGMHALAFVVAVAMNATPRA